MSIRFAFRPASLALVAIILSPLLFQAPTFANTPFEDDLMFLYAEGIISVQTIEAIAKLRIAFADDSSGAKRTAHPKSASAAPSSTGAYSFSSTPPGLPFAGNQLVILGAALFANNINVSAVALRRQPDCSLVEAISSGILDIGAGNLNDYKEVFLGAGDGTLRGTNMALGQQPFALGAVDLNGDGLPDPLISPIFELAVFLNVTARPVF